MKGSWRKKSGITQLCKRLGYQFKQDLFLKEALTHRSAGVPNNERLEFLGDSVLNFAMSDMLLERFPKSAEGALSRLRAALVKGDSLAELAIELSLGDVVILGPGELRSGGHRRASILADTLEAILGAIYLDAGFEVTKEVIGRLFEEKISQPELEANTLDSKTFLQESLQAQKKPLPLYELTEVTGETHDQVFFVSCSVLGLSFVGKGRGSTRRRAEQAAALDLLNQLNLRIGFANT
jgi:ribonuclease-3